MSNISLSLKYRAEIKEDIQAPVLFLVHGRAGNLDVMWTFKRYLPEDCHVISMEAPLSDPEEGGYSWWLVNQPITREAIESAAMKLQNFMDEAIDSYGLKPKSVIAAGFSQGAACLSVLFQSEPARFVKVALLAGFVVKQKTHPALDRTFERPKIFIAHGTQDQVVTLEKAEEGRNYLCELGFEVLFVTDPVAHKVGTSGMKGLREFLLNH